MLKVNIKSSIYVPSVRMDGAHIDWPFHWTWLAKKRLTFFMVCPEFLVIAKAVNSQVFMGPFKKNKSHPSNKPTLRNDES
jgi:hypothetical protein